MADLHAAVVGFDITPPIHPQYGAWGTTPKLKTVDMPLLSRCVALEQDDRRLLWCGSDDGLIHVSRNGGESWDNVTPKKMPEWAQVNSIDVDPRSML